MGERSLRVVHVVGGEPVDEKTFARPQAITVGTSRGCTFVIAAPQPHLGEAFPLFRASPGGVDFLLTVVPGMSGKLCIDREQMAVSEFVRSPLRGGVRERVLAPADWGIVGLDERGDVAFFFQFVAPGEAMPSGGTWLDEFLRRGM